MKKLFILANMKEYSNAFVFSSTFNHSSATKFKYVTLDGVTIRFSALTFAVNSFIILFTTNKERQTTSYKHQECSKSVGKTNQFLNQKHAIFN